MRGRRVVRSVVTLAEEDFSIDFSRSSNKNDAMKTTDQASDKEALLDHLFAGKPLAADVYSRIRQRQEDITRDLRKENGEMNIAVDLIREARDES